MANWIILKNAIASVIKTNGNHEITGQLLQNTFNNVINALGENATFAGIATPTTNPGSPDGPVFYFAVESGTYSNFNSITLKNPGLTVLYNDSKWHALEVYVCAQDLGNSTQATISQKAVTDAINNEIKNRTSVDLSLQNTINSEIKRSTDKDTELQNTINSEIKRSTDKDTELQNTINSITILPFDGKYPTKPGTLPRLPGIYFRDGAFVFYKIETYYGFTPDNYNIENEEGILVARQDILYIHNSYLYKVENGVLVNVYESIQSKIDIEKARVDDLQLLSYNITPKNTEGFLSNVHYDSDDFSDSQITEYNDTSAGRQDQCLPYIINASGSVLYISDSPEFASDPTRTRTYTIEDNSVELFNLIPNKQLYYKVDNSAYKTIKINGSCRWLKLDSLKNVRDLGGIKTSLGKYIKYGLLYRGSEFSGNNGINISSNDLYELTSILGVNTELDLRRIDEMAGHTSGTLSNYLNIAAPDFNDIENISDEEIIKLKNAISYIIVNATYGYPLYYHCAWGCHRVGLITCILYSLLGVPQCEIDKEYELSSFSDFGIFPRNVNDYHYKRCNEYIREIYGSWYNWACDKLGIKDDIVEQFRQALIVDYTELPFITEKEVEYVWENKTPDTPYAPY